MTCVEEDKVPNTLFKNESAAEEGEVIGSEVRIAVARRKLSKEICDCERTSSIPVKVGADQKIECA